MKISTKLIKKKTNKILINLQIACNNQSNLPTKTNLLRWLQSVLLMFCDNYVEVTVRLVDEKEITKLNSKFRGKNEPTNILSFPFERPSQIIFPLLGDLVVCRQVVEREARQQKKNLEAHWAHIIVHGSLHLLGYNHILNEEALSMESLEISIMKKMGYSNPYL